MANLKESQMDELVLINRNSRCSFCGTSKNDILKFGPLYKLGNIRAHYYCVLLSNRLIQNGNDNDGILGFLLSDIQKELHRTSGVTCTYCNKGHATIKCAAKGCKRSFHLPCGIKGGSLHEFTDQFKSYCHVHRPTQRIPRKILQEACKTDVICCICYEKVQVKNKTSSLWAPCCIRTWYHRFCVQKLAYSAGYFFRCAACNDVQIFNKWMQRFGIFIPQQDASWELVPNAFEDLLYRHDRCDAEICKCPHGRKKNADNTIWEIILCESCGSQGIHVACGNLKFLDPEWECPSCQKVTQNVKSASETNYSNKLEEGSSEEGKLSKLPEVCHKKRRRGSEDLKNSLLDKRKKCRTLVGEEKGEEIEIDVETIEEEIMDKDGPVDEKKDILGVEVVEDTNNEEAEFQEVLSILKPGPLSYKLSIIQKLCESPPPEKTNQDSDSLDIIVLSDSEEEKECVDNTKAIEEDAKQKSEDNLDFIFSEEPKKESEKDVKVEMNDKDNAKKISDEDTFSFTLETKKWELDDELRILNEIPTKTGFMNDMNRSTSPSNFFPSTTMKNMQQRYPQEELSVKDCQLNKFKSDFKKNKGFRIPDDEVVILID